ncbi:MAG: TIGR03905 family TSCPD domain-containing protein [Ruminococcaceae bacterium]|nr:TIGR03905 family TSCPD domain-containing protein [Oscillospiraceae bacterium]
MQFTYKTNGVCSTTITIDVIDDIVQSVKFTGGCNGNLQGISSLVKGMSVDEVISKLENIRCGFKNTSCPDQLARALKQYREE